MIDKQQILDLVSQYIKEKHETKIWTPGVDWVQYSGPYFDSEEFVAGVDTLLKEWLVLGEDAIKFEKEFPKQFGKQHGIVTNSGSSANLLMMLAAKRLYRIPYGSKVIVPVAGFPTTLNPILQLNLTPVFTDIELDTLNLNLDQVEEEAKKGVSFITFAHVLGNPPNMDRLMDIVNKHQLILLEDCCDALGSTYRGRPVGTDGKMATCSFYPAHHMTMGEGGFLACDSKEMEIIARSFREWGRGCYCVGKKANLSIKGTCGCRFKPWLPALPNEIFDHKYVYNQIGYNLKPIELQCSLGLAQMKKLPEIHSRRKENHETLAKVFRPYEEFFHFHNATPNSDPSWFAFPITIRDNAPFKRSDFTSYLEDKKIQTRNYFGGNLLLQPAYENLLGIPPNFAAKLFPIATKVTTDTLFLGTSPVITTQQLNYVQQTVDNFLKTI